VAPVASNSHDKWEVSSDGGQLDKWSGSQREDGGQLDKWNGGQRSERATDSGGRAAAGG
jgi:hypothetical protein